MLFSSELQVPMGHNSAEGNQSDCHLRLRQGGPGARRYSLCVDPTSITKKEQQEKRSRWLGPSGWARCRILSRFLARTVAWVPKCCCHLDTSAQVTLVVTLRAVTYGSCAPLRTPLALIPLPRDVFVC